MIDALTNFFNSSLSVTSSIIIIAAIILAAFREGKKMMSMTKEERLEELLSIVKHELLGIMSDAEVQWSEYKKSGEIKRSQVIKEIYDRFPALSEFVDQDKIIDCITDMIDDEMENMNKVLSK